VAIRKASRLDCATCSRALAAVLLAVVCSTAGAQDADARIKALEKQVEALKMRVDVLEGRTPAASARQPPAECPGWDRLRMNMTQAEVRSAIGAPAKIDTTPLQARWRYACGTAYFDADTQRFVGYESNAGSSR
jgi:hypothetical protein